MISFFDQFAPPEQISGTSSSAEPDAAVCAAPHAIDWRCAGVEVVPCQFVALCQDCGRRSRPSDGHDLWLAPGVRLAFGSGWGRIECPNRIAGAAP